MHHDEVKSLLLLQPWCQFKHAYEKPPHKKSQMLNSFYDWSFTRQMALNETTHCSFCPTIWLDLSVALAA